MIYPFTSVLDIMKPSKIDPKKATQVATLKQALKSPEYFWEEKLDGISILSIGGRLYSNVISKKTGFPSEKSQHLPYVYENLSKLGSYLILDGEAYLPGYKSNDVTSITNSAVDKALIKQSKNQFLQYHVYDILRDIDGTWLTNQPFEIRRHRLEEIFRDHLASSKSIVLNSIHRVDKEDPQAAFESLILAGYEGIVLKHKDGFYLPGKRPQRNQIKLKANLTDDVVIIGFNPPTRRYSGKNLESWLYWEDGEPVTKHHALGLIGSIVIGKYNAQGELVEVGNITGLKDDERSDMTSNPDKYIGQVAKIKAMEITEDGKYRHANYKGLHGDKRAEECKIGD